eukprot:CAMPEP_0179489836 /NCGR_PEP_ID=MMETSP0799-20121207/65077_1 /TAXON_ID=46947 /ORGANISM="Geminigera cryophila, Strain CCMP2564" /LENGTH=88 /DNA_ID=CAMNT_0021305867 /DNA_START=10 /DNA_END=273 /DNA_ORIENTATION=-
MGAAESTEQEPPGIATAMMRLKSQKSAGEISEQVFDAEMKALLASAGTAPPVTVPPVAVPNVTVPNVTASNVTAPPVTVAAPQVTTTE